MKKNKIVIIICLFLIFLANTIIVLNNGYDAIDSFVYASVIRYASEMTSKFMHFITFFGSTKWIIIVCLIIFGAFLYKKQKNCAFSIASLIIISTVVNNVIKLLVKRARPVYMIVTEHSYAYPSGHTMASATVYGFLIYLLIKSDFSKKYKIIYSAVLGLLILFVGLSRIYLGAHFFSDVFSGIVLSVMIILIFDVINERKKILK